MANLLTEYCKRHGKQFVVPTNDGFCFFEKNNKPAVVCLTSSAPKTITVCDLCNSQESQIIVETFAAMRDNPLTLINHFHANPDEDLISKIKLSPVYLADNRGVELWLWKFFSARSRIVSLRRWQILIEEQKSTEPTKTYEQMMWTAINCPKWYTIYYSMYQTVTAGRKYLLFE